MVVAWGRSWHEVPPEIDLLFRRFARPRGRGVTTSVLMNMSLTTNSSRIDTTTDRRAVRADTVITALHTLSRELDAAPSLEPGPAVDELFDRLVRLVLAVPDACVAEIMRDPAIAVIGARLRELCARGETALETAWAARIATAATPRAELEQFPYLDNYRRLSRMEVGVLASAATTRVRSVAFVGAGPLPLSALFIAGELNVPVDLIDRDPLALDAAGAVAHALGYPDLRLVEADAANADLSRYDIVVLAALVGTGPGEKQRILAHLASAMAPRSILLARSARGLRTVLYPAIDVDAMTAYDVLSVVHPVNDVINSVVLARTSSGQ